MFVTLRQISAGANPPHRVLCCPEHPLPRANPARGTSRQRRCSSTPLKSKQRLGTACLQHSFSKIPFIFGFVERKPEPVGTGGLWSPQARSLICCVNAIWHLCTPGNKIKCRTGKNATYCSKLSRCCSKHCVGGKTKKRGIRLKPFPDSRGAQRGSAMCTRLRAPSQHLQTERQGTSRWRQTRHCFDD